MAQTGHYYLAATAFIECLDQMMQALDNTDFVHALPAMRAAFAWLPPQERGALADQILALHHAHDLSRSTLTRPFTEDTSAEDWAAAHAAEAAALADLQTWGIACGLER